MGTFDKIVGQKRVKDELEMYLAAYEKTRIFPKLLLVAPKGSGKTHVCRLTGKALKKPMVEYNGSALKNVKQLVEHVFIPNMDKEYTLFIDEIHALQPKIENALLTILQMKADKTSEFRYEDMVFNFDFRKFTFIAATTEKQGVFEPLLDRMYEVSFEEYSADEVGTMIRLNANGISFDDSALEILSTYCRGNGRSAASMGERLTNYCQAFDVTHVTGGSVKQIVDKLNIFPLGLTTEEVRILKLIGAEMGGIKLTTLCSRSGYTSAAQQSMEKYLLKLGLIERDTKGRVLTGKGRDYLKGI